MSNPYKVKRLYDILPGTVTVNTQVHTAIANAVTTAGKTIPANPTPANPAPTPWLYYQLIGVQYQPMDSVATPTLTQSPNQDTTVVNQADNDPSNIGQPQYLSNLVIETNHGLQQFQGLPPGATVNSFFAGNGSKVVSNTSNDFERTALNLSFGKTGRNMGGCMGCHGVAQIRGYSFSFVLLGGQAGADPDSEKQFAIPLSQPASN